MNKWLISGIIILLGLSLAIYGYVRAPVSNESAIRSTYRCDRTTKESSDTDKYCYDPSSAPEASKQITNSYVYSGVALVTIGSAYFVVNRKQQNI